LAVHHRRGGEMLLRLLAVARAPVELAEAEVAVGDEQAHAELAGELQRLAVGAFGVVRTGCRCDVTQEAKGLGLARPSSCSAGEPQGLASVGGGLVEPPG